jgi:glutathione S-transferase
VPTLIHDGEPITESSLILYYIDDAFPERRRNVISIINFYLVPLWAI